MSNIPVDEASERVERAAKLRATLMSPGWVEIIKPNLEQKRDRIIEELLTKTFSDVSQLRYYQESVNLIDGLLGDLEHILNEGEDADMELNPLLKAEKTMSDSILQGI